MKYLGTSLSRLLLLVLASAPAANAGTTAYRAVVLADNPIIYYELDETSGTTAVNSATTGATYDSSLFGTITVGQASFPQGGTSYDFGGGRSVAAALTSSLTEWTVEAWVNYDSAKTSASNFVSNDQGGWNDDVLIGIGAENGQIPAGHVGVVHQDNANQTRDTVSLALAADEWHHVAITGQNGTGPGTSTLTLYIDGVQVAQTTGIVGNVTFNGAGGFGGAPHVTLGASRIDGFRPYDGLLDEVAIYDGVLAPARILEHYNTGSSTAGVPPAISALSPADGSSAVAVSADLVATFTEPVVPTGVGTVTIRNLTLGAGGDTVITLPDPRVTVSDSTLTINPTTDLDQATSYAVQITADAIEDAQGDAFAGILDDEGWNFVTATPPGLVGKWEFESEAGGVTPDSSGNGHDGTLEGNANLVVDPERGSVLELSGLGVEGDRVNINSTVEIPTLPAGRGATLAAWIKRNADASAGDRFAYPIGIGQGGNFPIITIGINDATGFVTGFIEGDGAGGDQVEVIGDTVVPDGVWTHIAITYDRMNNEASTYVNGVPQATPTGISLVGDGALDWDFGLIGRNVSGAASDANHFGGLVDDVCYFDKVLTPAEVLDLALEEARITSFEAAGATGVINQAAKTIALEVPFGTDLATLAPTFTLTSGSCDQTSGSPPSPTFAAQNPVDYVVTDTSTDPDTVNTYSVTVTVAPETATIVIDLGGGTEIKGGAFIGSGPTNLPLPSLPTGSLLQSIEVNTTLTATDNDNFASDLALLFDPTPGDPGNDFSVGISRWLASAAHSAATQIEWDAATGEGGFGTPLVDSFTAADWAGSGAIDLGAVGLFLGNNFDLDAGETLQGGIWSGTITLTYVVPGGGGSDYDTWAAGFLPADVSDPDGDLDGDGLTNNEERAFGLDPTDPASVNPFAVPLAPDAGTLSYTRRDPSLSGLTYSVWTSTDLQVWTEDTGVVEGSITANGDVQTVPITLTATPVDGRLFVEIRAN